VLLDREGKVAEAPTANVFLVRGGSLVTPPLGRVLPGITRDTVLAVAQAERVPAREEALTAADMETADEAFLVATSLPVQAVASVNGKVLVGGAPGRMTTWAREAIGRCERGEDPRFTEWAQRV
jgi:branched-chain amino acid aminotransferase